MGYYMRYVVVDKKDLDLDMLEHSLRAYDPAYAIVTRQKGRNAGDLTHGGEVCAQIEINRPHNGLFDDEIQELVEFANEADGKGKKTVLRCLKKARLIVAVQVLFQNRETETTLQKIDPLWQWLFANREGMLQADGEGYYKERGELVLECG